MHKPWDLCGTFQCRRPTWDGQKVKEREKRFCSFHHPEKVRQFLDSVAGSSVCRSHRKERGCRELSFRWRSEKGVMGWSARYKEQGQIFYVKLSTPPSYRLPSLFNCPKGKQRACKLSNRACFHESNRWMLRRCKGMVKKSSRLGSGRGPGPCVVCGVDAECELCLDCG